MEYTAYRDLNPNDKAVFNKIESIFTNSPSLTKSSFVKALSALVEKYKRKVREDETNK